MSKVKEIAKMIDHSILSPLFTDADLQRECKIAVEYDVASVCVKPYAVKQAVELLRGSDVFVGCVIGFPAGNSATIVKEFETEQACIDGAVEIDMVINIGKALQGDWAYVEEEIKAVVDMAHKYNAITKVIFENDYVTKDDDKIKLCEICTKVGAEYVKTSTGYGFVKGEDGKFSYVGATAHDIALMRKHSGPNVQVKAAGGVRTLKDMLILKELGITRCGSTVTAQVIADAKIFFGEE